MATKKYLELQDYSDADLKSELENIENQYQKLQFDHTIRGLDNPLTLREVRRDIARLKTEIRRREIAAMGEEDLNGRDRLRDRRKRQKKSK